MISDFQFGWRQMRKYPGYALAVVLTLALGIGVNTAVFSMVDGFMLRKPPYPQPERIGAIMLRAESEKGAGEQNNLTGAAWEAIKGNVPAVILAASGGSNGVNLKAGADAGSAVQYVHNSRVSAHYFDVLGIPMHLGRSFTEEEDRPEGPAVVVLSYKLWQSAFHSSPEILGKTIQLKGEPHTVVGVLPRNAVTPTNADVFTPLQPSSTSGECGGQNCHIFARLKPGATWQQANAQLRHVRLPFFSAFENKYHGHTWFYARPLQLDLAGKMRDETSMLMLAVSFILLIACANLAGLALVRVARRTAEIATRLALGATRSAILRQLWVEGLVLALAGAAAGLFLAVLVLDALKGLLPEQMVPVGGIHLDARVLAFTFAVSILASLLFGALPALLTRRVDIRTSLAAGSHAVIGGHGRLRQWLIGAEIALTVVLLAAAGLLVRTLVHLETLPPGFDPTNIITAKASLDDARYHDPAAFQELLEKSVAAMQQIPGVEKAAVGLSVPYETALNDYIIIADGKQAGTGIACSLVYVTPGYFSTLRIPVLAGRTFTEDDAATSQMVAVVNTAFGKHYYNDPLPMGRHFKSGKNVVTIIGVVGNTQDQSNVERDAPIGTEPMFYVPYTQVPASGLSLIHIWLQPSWIVRTQGPIQGITEAMQKALAKADPDLPFSGFYSMQQILDKQLQEQRIQVLLLTVLGGLALMLSAIGIYSLVSNLVVQRTREIGIRIAFGSTLQQAIVHIGASGLMAAGAGLIAGMALSFVALRALSGYIYGVKTYDPVTFAAVVLVLALIAVAAGFLPALRISRIDPAETLRVE